MWYSSIESEGFMKLVRYYHILVNGHRITDEPMTLDQIRLTYGSIRDLEMSGHMLWPVEVS